jgi:hypothetical protein
MRSAFPGSEISEFELVTKCGTVVNAIMSKSGWDQRCAQIPESMNFFNAISEFLKSAKYFNVPATRRELLGRSCSISIDVGSPIFNTHLVGCHCD